MLQLCLLIEPQYCQFSFLKIREAQTYVSCPAAAAAAASPGQQQKYEKASVRRQALCPFAIQSPWGLRLYVFPWFFLFLFFLLDGFFKK